MPRSHREPKRGLLHAGRNQGDPLRRRVDSGKINEEWDRKFLAPWAANDRESLLSYSDSEIYRDGGQGGFEIRTFIAAAAAREGRQGHDPILRAGPGLRRQLHRGKDGDWLTFRRPDWSAKRRVEGPFSAISRKSLREGPSTSLRYARSDGAFRNVTTRTSRWAGWAGFSGSTGVTPW